MVDIGPSPGSAVMAERLEDILGGVEEEIRRAEERLRLDVTRPKSSAGTTRARSVSGEGDLTGVTPVFEARLVEGSVTSRESVARRLLQDALLPERRDALKRKPRRRRAWVDLEKDCPDITSNGGEDSNVKNGNRRFNGSQGRREAIVERLLKEREERLRSTMASAAAASTDTDVDRTDCADFSKREVARDQSDGSSSGGIDDIGRNFDENYRDTRRRKNLNSPDSRGDEFGELNGFSGGVIPVSDQGNVFFASDIVDAEDRAVDSPRGDDVDISRLLLQGGRASESPRRRGRDRTPERSLPSLTDDQGGKASQQTPTMNKSSHGDLLMDSLINEGIHKESGGDAVRSGQGGVRRENAARELGVEGVEDDCLAAARRLEDLLSFRPRMDRRSSLQVMGEKSSTHAGGGGLSGGSTRRIEELARSRRAIYCEREKQRKKLQEEKETKECTFRPKITAVSKRSGKEGDSDGDRRSMALHERLHGEARKKEAARALAQLHLEAEYLRECTFQPSVNAVNAAAPVAKQRPLQERVWEVERERQHNLRRLEADKDEREGVTFAPPPLGRVSQRLLRKAGAGEGEGEGGGGVAMMTRLQEQAYLARERRRLRLQEYEEAEAKKSTFEPRISRGTESIVRRQPELRVPFEQRQAIMEARAKERARRRFAVRADEERRWFNPHTARRTEALLRHRMPQRLEETVEQRVERMTSAEDKRRRELVSLQREKEKRECTFRPSLNTVTQSVGRAAPLDELVNNRRGQRVRERAEAKIREEQVYPHKPALLAEAALLRQQQQRRTSGSPSAWALHDSNGDGDVLNGDDCYVAGVAGIRRDRDGISLYGPDNKYRMNLREPWRMTANMRARERQQGEKIRALRQKQEVTEMLPCTFVPKTNHRILRAHGPVLVRGLGRHLELKDIAQQRMEEQREREAQAFGVRPGAVHRTVLGETVLKPFSLSEGNNKGWWEERRRKHEKERAAQHPFKPWTVEGERGRALSRLLEVSSVLASSSGIG